MCAPNKTKPFSSQSQYGIQTNFNATIIMYNVGTYKVHIYLVQAHYTYHHCV